MRKPLLAALVTVALFSTLAAPVWAQQTISGTVRDAKTGNPVESAQVYIPGTNIGTLTDFDGQYDLVVVPVGRFEVRVEIIGYRTTSQTVDVAGGERTIADFALEPTVLRLQELVVTGTATRMPRAKLPFTVEKVDLEDMPVPSTGADQQLRAKAAGIHITRGNAEPGDQADILLRAPTSITQTQGPLIIIDGVVTWNSLADIDALDIESMEVVKGAAGASLYGSLAANGVIQITTKRGAGLVAGENLISVRGEYGAQSLEGSIPLNQYHIYQMNADQTAYLIDTDNDGLPDDEGPYGPGVLEDTLWSGVGGPFVTFQDKPYAEQTYDHVKRFFDPGEFSSFNASVTGRTSNTNYRASFTTQKEGGVLLYHDGYRRRNARLNIDHRIWDNLSLSLGGYYAWTEADEIGTSGVFFDLTFLPPNMDLGETFCQKADRLAAAARPDSLLMQQYCEQFGPDALVIQPDELNNEEANPLHALKEFDQSDKQSRLMGSVLARWSPWNFLDIEGSFGLDRNDYDYTNYQPKGVAYHIPPLGSAAPGYLRKFGSVNENVNTSLTATFHKQLGDFITRLQGRYLYEDRHYEDSDASGRDLGVEDVPRLSNTDPTQTSIDSEIRDINSDSYYLIAQADYKGKYIFDGLVRRDGSSLFGPNERWQTYYRGSVAWRPSEEGFWPFAPLIDATKLRYSYGTAGGRPQFDAQYETYSVQAGVITPENLGNKDLKPEYAIEQELGLEMLIGNRVNFVLNYSDNKTEDALLYVPLAGYTGFLNQWQNAGTIEGSTWEASLETALLQKADMTWTARLNWDRSRQKITQLDVPPYRTGWNDEFYIREGESLGTYYGNRWATSCNELAYVAQDDCLNEFQVNDEGLLVWTGGEAYTAGISNELWGTTGDVDGFEYTWGMPIKALECVAEEGGGKPTEQCATTDFLRIGDGVADYAWSLSTNFRWKNLGLYLLFDSEVGQDVYFQTGQWAMRENKSAYTDQFGKSDELKKPYAYTQALYNVNEINSFYVRDGTYVKLRELALSYTFNRDMLSRLFGGVFERATIQLIGRNLFTFTDYPGYDPEVGYPNWVGSAVIGRTDAYQYPNYRTITGMVEITF